jgi:hypothetical protein
MESIEKDYGYLVKENGEVYNYEGGQTDNGFVYKDYEAFKSGVGVCYLSEYELDELHEELTDLVARYENTDMADDEYWDERAEILERYGETRQSIIDQVRDAFGDDYTLTDEQVEYLASDVFQLADWAYISTYLDEDFDIESLIEFDHDFNPEGRRLFNDFQYEAVMHDMYPSEYKK